MKQQVTVVGGGVVGLATAYALVREGRSVDLIEARDSLASATSFANGGQLSYRYVAPLADAGVPWQALGWLLQGESPLRLRLRMDPAQWRWLLAFTLACRRSVNRRNAGHLLELALYSQAVLAQWREHQNLGDFAWRRNGKLVAFRSERAFAQGREQLTDPASQQVLAAAELRALEPALDGAPFVGGVFTAGEEVGDCHVFCLRLEALLRVGPVPFPAWPASDAIGSAPGPGRGTATGRSAAGRGAVGAVCWASRPRLGITGGADTGLPAEGLQPDRTDQRRAPAPGGEPYRL